MSDITVKYKGSTIATMDASGTKTLETQGKYCEDDIGIEYAKPSGSSYTLLGETEFTVNTTAGVMVGNVMVDSASDVWTSAKMIYIRVRDKAGKRNGYFFGTDTFFANPIPANGDAQTATPSSALRYTYTYDNDQFVAVPGSSAYGLYGYDINNSGRVRIYARYNATQSLTIDGTYKIEVYALKYPDDVSPFV